MSKSLCTVDEKTKPSASADYKTILDDLLEKYPHVKLDGGIPTNICPDYLGYRGCDRCIRNCSDCWNRPLISTTQI